MAQMARLVSLLVMGAVIVLLGGTFYHVIAPFLLPLFLAGVLAVLCQPIYQRFLRWTKNRTPLAAGLTTFTVLATILVPLALGTIAAARELYSQAQTRLKGSDWTELVEFVESSGPFESLVRHYEGWTGETVDRDELRNEIQTKIREGSVTLARKTLGYAGSTIKVVGSAVSLLISTLTFVIAFYYFLADGPALISATEKLIPVHRDYVRHLLAKFDQAVRGVVTATFAAALGQGIATGIGMEIAGFHHFFIVTILSTLTALVPVLGTWLIWGPYVLWLGFHEESWGWATSLALYGALFVGLLDNVIRTYVLQSNIKLHPLLAFVCVLGGIEVLGLWGVFIGPIVASCLYALVTIFNAELKEFSREQQLHPAPEYDSSRLAPAATGDGAPAQPAAAAPSDKAASPEPPAAAKPAKPESTPPSQSQPVRHQPAPKK
ncbi:MAG: AI-2E family transporter [Planctomycetia bacterium]|nr:AI-2E family transporter [Planctomycetia bacterium]